MESPQLVEVRIDGRITPASVLDYTGPLLGCLDAGEPVRVLFDRRTISAPTPAGRAALNAFYLDWPRLAPLVVAWADVYDVRRAQSLLRARQARAERGALRAMDYPYRLFDDLGEARAWLDVIAPAPARVLVDAAS